MVKGMGESSFDDLLPWLMQTLTSESSSVDRSGAAQGKISLLLIDPFVKDFRFDILESLLYEKICLI